MGGVNREVQSSSAGGNKGTQGPGGRESKVRLNKYLADHGVCSRREADRLIAQGRVEVNGRTAATGCKVTEQDSIAVNGRQLQGKPKRAVLAFYKPVGVTCTEQDKHAEKIINDYVHKENVKVYRNVQAVVVEEAAKHTENLEKLSKDGAGKIRVIIGVSAVALAASLGSLIFQILTYLHVI